MKPDCVILISFDHHLPPLPDNLASFHVSRSGLGQLLSIDRIARIKMDGLQFFQVCVCVCVRLFVCVCESARVRVRLCVFVRV